MHSPSIRLAAALEYAAAGFPVIPLHTPTGEAERPCDCGRPDCSAVGKHSRIRDWPHRATTDPEQLRYWWGMWQEANVGLLTGKLSNLCVLDVDGTLGKVTIRQRRQRYGRFEVGAWQITGSGGWQFFFPYVPGLGNKCRFAPGLDIRSEGGYVVVPPSLHPSGREYGWEKPLIGAHLLPAPDWLLIEARGKQPGAPEAAEASAGETIREGSRNASLASLAGSMRRRGMAAPEIEAALLVTNRTRVDPPLDESEVREIASKIARYPPAENGRLAENGATPFVASGAFVAQRPEYGAAPKAPAEEAFHGIAGEVVHFFEPHTESAPVALLVSFLVMIGNVLGRGPHFWIEGARHGTNLFAVLVGPSGNARKGTATRRIDELLSSIDCNWTKNIARGLSSGEGLIHHVRDPRVDQVPVKKSGRYTGEYDEVIVDQGVEDKRAMIREEEFAAVLKVAGREGNTLSVRVREAWDNVRMGSLTKGSKETATDPHISILGHITDLELQRYLTATEGANGFANRFLWVCTHRSKFLPRGGSATCPASLVYQIHESVEAGQQLTGMTFGEEAGRVWDAVYQGLTSRPAGMFGSITSRADPQVLRLAVLYAALDGSPLIGTAHLFAALALWDFCEASARYVFGTATGDEVADQIEEFLMEAHPGYLTRTELRDKFARHAPPGRVPKALAHLKQSGRARLDLLETGGRPTECWTAILRTERDKSDGSDKSHLERAREAAIHL